MAQPAILVVGREEVVVLEQRMISPNFVCFFGVNLLTTD
jgi:hypothetical protein